MEPTEPPHPRVGDRLTVTIEGLAAGGDGIARPGGFALFVPRTAPGDIAEVEVVKAAPSYGRAELVTLCEAGPDRVEPACALAREGRCPGCPLQHLRYEAQLEAKRTFVRDGLERIGHLRGIEVLPTLGMDDPWRYRNKGEFMALTRDGQVRLGYHAEGEDGFVPVDDCPIQHPLSLEILHAVEAVATEEGLPLAQLITRISPHDGQALAILVCWEWHDRLPAAAEAVQARVPALAGVLWSKVRGRSVVRRTLGEVLSGRGRLVQKLGQWEYTVSGESFFQVNSTQATRLVQLVGEQAAVTGDETVVDGYCGVGTFLIPLAARASRAIGVEEHPTALRDAEDNLARYALHGVKMFEGRVEAVFPRLVRRGRTVNVAVLDPPRKGAGPAALESMAQLGVSRVVLVSCDPATLGRDAGDLNDLGYRITTVQPVDMFPQTWHVESVALAVREK